jgi:methylisocitrate lyase
MNGSDPGATLRAQIEAAEIAVMPGVYDALSGMLAEGAGFETVFTSGFSISATQLGKPDLGLLTMSENLRQIRSIVPSLSVPLVADLDTGYGNALNVRRTIEEAMDAGVAGGILEDQQWPKRCGHMEEKSVVDADEHARRIRAAADVRAERDGDFVIIGRTDAREPHGLEEAVRRGHVYADAGADVVFVEAPRSRAELEAIAAEFDVPTFANMIEGGQTPYLPASELGAIGFDIVVYPLSGLFAATRALQETYATLAADGTAGAAETVDFEAFEAAIGAEAFRERERRYAGQSDGG